MTKFLFYSDKYHVELPKGHPFPINKYPDSLKSLLEEKVATVDQVEDPGLAREDDILTVHQNSYYAKLRYGTLTKAETRKLGFPWSRLLFNRSRAAVAGTISAVQHAQKTGLGINLAGGTHHAFPDHGEGYCVFNDVAIAAKKLIQKNNDTRILIVDLDAHQGNGTNYIFAKNKSVFTYSIHVGANYPRNKHPGNLDIELERWVDGNTYLSKLSSSLPDVVDSYSPDLAVFIAGVDVHENDRFGQMKLSTDALLERDEFTIDLFRQKEIPLAIVLGGGYNKEREVTTSLHCQTVKTAIKLF